MLQEIKDEKNYNPLELDTYAPFQQAWFYGTWHKNNKEEVRRFAFVKNGKTLVLFQAYKCTIPKIGSYLTIPYGPIISKEINEKDLNEFLNDFYDLLKKENLIFARLDFSPSLADSPLSLKKDDADKILKTLSLHKHVFKTPWYAVHGACFQPRREWVLPLNKTEDELLSGMHQKTRYNIRLAFKKQVETKIISENLTDYFDDFYRLQELTAKRNGFSLHERNYYKSVLQDATERKNGFLVFAYHENDLLTANFVINYGKIAMFAYGGSVPFKRNLMSSYATHWSGIVHAKSLGLEFYNFGGYFDEKGPKVKPETLKARSRFSVFKRKFGGFSWEHSPFYDLVANPFKYKLYMLYKKIRHV